MTEHSWSVNPPSQCPAPAAYAVSFPLSIPGRSDSWSVRAIYVQNMDACMYVLVVLYIHGIVWRFHLNSRFSRPTLDQTTLPRTAMSLELGNQAG